MFTTALFIIAKKMETTEKKNGNNLNVYWLIVDEYNVVNSYIGKLLRIEGNGVLIHVTHG